jgi:hypothetical protein
MFPSSEHFCSGPIRINEHKSIVGREMGYIKGNALFQLPNVVSEICSQAMGSLPLETPPPYSSNIRMHSQPTFSQAGSFS